MQHVDANELLNHARRLHSGVDEDGNPVEKDTDTASEIYHQILTHNVGNPLVLYCLGTLEMEREHWGMALQLMGQVCQVSPQMPEAWNNLGLIWRGLLKKDQARECFEKAMKHVPEDKPLFRADLFSNMSGMHINEGSPEEGLEYADKSLALAPGHKKSQWHRALCLLELQRFKEAWIDHEVRLDPGAANYNIAERNYHPDGMTPWWDGKSPGLIAIHGEQGLGDEIMFASCIADMMKVPGTKFVLEPSPRMHALYRRSFPDAHVVGTNDVDGNAWVPQKGKPDYKIALGSLPKFCRQQEADFPGTPYIIANPKMRRVMRRRLDKLGSRPKIGITWQGGVESTAVHLRSIFPKDLAPILCQDADFISLQYTHDAAANIATLQEETGLVIHHWPEVAQARNIDRPVALIAELDMLITVCQSAVHFAGAVGTPTLCLTPSKASWRYGVTGNLPWYNSVDLIRQEGDNWTSAIEDAASRLEAFINERKEKAA
jgi:tetratricopeptide (TPR) repeat protein